MQTLFPGKNHSSILSHALYTAITFITCFALITPHVHAICKPGVCTNSTDSPCTVKSPVAGSTPTSYCCTGTNGGAECIALKSAVATGKAPNYSTANSNMSTNPTDGCSETEINTALGCISVETKGFSATLLRFLAGTSGAISLVLMLIATIQIMTGGDNAEQVKKGKELFTGAITGLLFIIFSVALLRIIAGDIMKLDGFM